MRNLLKRELIVSVQYFLITCAAAVTGHYAWESAQQASGLNAAEGSGGAVNVQEMVIALWRDYYRWVVGAFLVLSVARILILIAVNRAKERVA